MESGNNYGAVNGLGYCGRWQFGAGALIDAGYVRAGTTNRNLLSPAAWTGKDGVTSRADWLARRDAQDAAMLTYTRGHYKSRARAWRAPSTSSPARIAGLLAAAHLMGIGGARHLVDGTVTHDANGTTTLKYYQQLSVALGGSGRLRRRRCGAAAIPPSFIQPAFSRSRPSYWHAVEISLSPTPRIVRERSEQQRWARAHRATHGA